MIHCWGQHVVDSLLEGYEQRDSLGANHPYIPVQIYSAYNLPSRGLDGLHWIKMFHSLWRAQLSRLDSWQKPV